MFNPIIIKPFICNIQKKLCKTQKQFKNPIKTKNNLKFYKNQKQFKTYKIQKQYKILQNQKKKNIFKPF